MRTILVIVSVVCCLIALPPAAFAQAESSPDQVPAVGPPKFTALVEVVIDMPDSIKQPFASCVLQELQSLGDVVVTGNNPQYRITIMGLPNKTSEENIGFTFSVLITRPFDKNLLRPLLLSENIGETEKRILMLVGSNYERIEKNSLLTTSPNELGHICREIVSGFETDLLAKDREIWQSFWAAPPEPGSP